MYKHQRILRILALLLAAALVLIPLCSALGFGDFDSDRDYGGGSDHSDSSDHSNSRDHSDSSDHSYSWEHSDSQKNRSSSGSAKISGSFILLFLLVTSVIGGICALIKIQKNMQHQNKMITERAEKADKEHVSAVEELKKSDPNFSDEKLIEHVKTLFTKMQETWEAGDIHGVQYGFKTDTWNRFNTQLQMKNARGEVTHVRDIDFQSVRITNYTGIRIDRLTVRILVDYNVWVTNKEGKCIQGRETTRHRMEYEWALERPAGTQTSESGTNDRNHCPHCGVELDLSAFAECPFCKTQISRNWSGWLLADIRALSQKTLQK